MNDIREMIINTAEKIFRVHCTKEMLHDAEKGTWPQTLWKNIEELGFTTVGVDERDNGTGGTMGDALALLKMVGKYAVPLQLAETMMGNWLLSKSGMDIVNGPLTVAPVNREDLFHFDKSPDGWHLTGKAENIPFGRHASKIIIVGESEEGILVAAVDSNMCNFQEGTNIAGESRDQVRLENVFVTSEYVGHVPAPMHLETLYMWGALTRIAMMVGGLERILEMSVNYSMEREQFGKQIAKFQAVQQQLAVLAGEVEAAKIAGAYSVEFEDFEYKEKEIMMAKIRISQAVNKATAITHQIHGAMGITDEYPLHYYTRRLWSWREEFGNETQWAEELGNYIFDEGVENIWSVVLS